MSCTHTFLNGSEIAPIQEDRIQTHGRTQPNLLALKFKPNCIVSYCEREDGIGNLSVSASRCIYNKGMYNMSSSFLLLTAGFDSSWVVVMGSLSSSHPQVMLLAMKRCCREKSSSWNTVRIRPQPVTCWDPLSHWARQLSLQHLWTPARCVVSLVMDNILVITLSTTILMVNA